MVVESLHVSINTVCIQVMSWEGANAICRESPHTDPVRGALRYIPWSWRTSAWLIPGILARTWLWPREGGTDQSRWQWSHWGLVRWFWPVSQSWSEWGAAQRWVWHDGEPSWSSWVPFSRAAWRAERPQQEEQRPPALHGHSRGQWGRDRPLSLPCPSPTPIWAPKRS